MHAIEPKCFACGSSLQRKREFKALTESAIYLYKCHDCGSEELYPQPPDEILAQEYADYFTRRTAFSGTEFPKELFFKELLEDKGPDLLPRSSRFSALELGAGNGDFIKAFNSVFSSAEITAVERNTESASRLGKLACKYVPLSIEDFLNGCRESYELIFLFDVLEHLRDPMGALKMISKILKPHGRIILTLPLTGTLLHRLTGRMWPQYKLEHLYYFSTESLRMMGSRLQLKTCEISLLQKKLPISYLLSVGNNFGPRSFSCLVKFIAMLTPSFLHGCMVRLSLGEAFVIYEKND